MKKTFLTLCIAAMTSLVIAQQNQFSPNDNTPQTHDPAYAPLLACDNEKGYFDFPFTENGITVTGTGTGSYTYLPGGWSSCGIFAKSDCIWIGADYSGPATFTNTFSQPVNDMIYNITAGDNGEIITITVNAGTPSITYTDGTCPSDALITGNVIAFQSYDNGGRFLIHSTSDFTSITFSHNGEANGSTMTMCFDQVLRPDEVPVSDWALFIGIGLILAFAIVRFRKPV